MKFHPHARVAGDVANVAGFHAVFRNDPELLAYVAIADGRATRLSTLAASRFEQSISGRDQPNGEHELDRRIEYVLLERVNNHPFHAATILGPLAKRRERLY